MFLRYSIGWVFHYQNIRNEVELRGDKYIDGKLKTLEEDIKTNFQSQDIPYDMYCNATSVLKF